MELLVTLTIGAFICGIIIGMGIVGCINVLKE